VREQDLAVEDQVAKTPAGAPDIMLQKKFDIVIPVPDQAGTVTRSTCCGIAWPD
jgi:hypothetical protein